MREAQCGFVGGPRLNGGGDPEDDPACSPDSVLVLPGSHGAPCSKGYAGQTQALPFSKYVPRGSLFQDTPRPRGIGDSLPDPLLRPENRWLISTVKGETLSKPRNTKLSQSPSLTRLPCASLG